MVRYYTYLYAAHYIVSKMKSQLGVKETTVITISNTNL